MCANFRNRNKRLKTESIDYSVSNIKDKRDISFIKDDITERCIESIYEYFEIKKIEEEEPINSFITINFILEDYYDFNYNKDSSYYKFKKSDGIKEISVTHNSKNTLQDLGLTITFKNDQFIRVNVLRKEILSFDRYKHNIDNIRICELLSSFINQCCDADVCSVEDFYADYSDTDYEKAAINFLNFCKEHKYKKFYRDTDYVLTDVNENYNITLSGKPEKYRLFQIALIKSTKESKTNIVFILTTDNKNALYFINIEINIDETIQITGFTQKMQKVSGVDIVIPQNLKNRIKEFVSEVFEFVPNI